MVSLLPITLLSVHSRCRQNRSACETSTIGAAGVKKIQRIPIPQCRRFFPSPIVRESPAVAILPSHRARFSLCRVTNRVSAFTSAHGTKPKWQLQRRGGVTHKFNRKRRALRKMSWNACPSLASHAWTCGNISVSACYREYTQVWICTTCTGARSLTPSLLIKCAERNNNWNTPLHNNVVQNVQNK